MARKQKAITMKSSEESNSALLLMSFLSLYAHDTRKADIIILSTKFQCDINFLCWSLVSADGMRCHRHLPTSWLKYLITFFYVSHWNMMSSTVNDFAGWLFPSWLLFKIQETDLISLEWASNTFFVENITIFFSFSQLRIKLKWNYFNMPVKPFEYIENEVLLLLLLPLLLLLLLHSVPRM